MNIKINEWKSTVIIHRNHLLIANFITYLQVKKKNLLDIGPIIYTFQSHSSFYRCTMKIFVSSAQLRALYYWPSWEWMIWYFKETWDFPNVLYETLFSKYTICLIIMLWSSNLRKCLNKLKLLFSQWHVSTLLIC